MCSRDLYIFTYLYDGTFFHVKEEKDDQSKTIIIRKY